MKRPRPFSTCHRPPASITPCAQTNTHRRVMEASGNKHSCAQPYTHLINDSGSSITTPAAPLYLSSLFLLPSLPPSGHVLWMLPNYTAQNSSYGAGTFICLFCISLPRSCMQNPSVIDLFILWLCLAEIKQWADWRGTVRDWWSILRLIRAESRDEVVKCASGGVCSRCFLLSPIQSV